MSHADSDRLELAILERLAADRAAGGLAALEAYHAAFPGRDELVARCYGAFAAEVAERETREADAIGPYRVLERLGAGGQGTVYLARDTRLGRLVALKLLPRTLLESDAPPAGIARELEALTRLDHPHIAGVFDTGSHDGRAFVVTRYVPGEPLDRLIARWNTSDPPALAERVAWIAKLAEALAAAHRAGVVHRDVKPSNVIVTQDGVPVLIDFGLARAVDSALPSWTRTGDVLGTPRYLSPERLRGEGRDDPRTDVWALGVVLYEVLSLAPPFEGPTLEALGRAIESSPVPRLQRSLAATASAGRLRDLEAVLSCALEKRAARRYADAAPFAADLARWIRGEPVSVRCPSSIDRAGRWMARNRAATALLFVLALGTLITAALALRLDQTAREERRARLEAQAHLAFADAERGRLLLEGRDLGRVSLALEHFAAAARSHAALRTAPDAPSELARLDLASLRSSAARALLSGDLAPAGSLEMGGLGHAFVSPTADVLVFYGLLGAERKLEVRAIEVESQRTLDLPLGATGAEGAPIAIAPALSACLVALSRERWELVHLEPQVQRLALAPAWSRALSRTGPISERASFSSSGRHVVVMRGDAHGGVWMLASASSGETLANGSWSGAAATCCEFLADGSALLVPNEDLNSFHYVACEADSAVPPPIPLALVAGDRLLAVLPVDAERVALAVLSGSALELRIASPQRAPRGLWRGADGAQPASARLAYAKPLDLLVLAAGAEVLGYHVDRNALAFEGTSRAGAAPDLVFFTPSGELWIHRRVARLARFRPMPALPFLESEGLRPPPAPAAAIERRGTLSAITEDASAPRARFLLADSGLPLEAGERGAALAIDSQAAAAQAPLAAARLTWIEASAPCAALVVVDRRNGRTLLERRSEGVDRDGAIALSADGRYLAEVDARGELALFDVEHRAEILRLEHTGIQATALAFDDGDLRAWDARGVATRLRLDLLRAALRKLDLAW